MLASVVRGQPDMGQFEVGHRNSSRYKAASVDEPVVDPARRSVARQGS